MVLLYSAAGFKLVSSENVFKVCDQPHPMVAKKLIESCLTKDFASAHKQLRFLWESGYSAVDIVGTLFRVAKNQPMEEYKKLEYLKVRQQAIRYIICRGRS